MLVFNRFGFPSGVLVLVPIRVHVISIYLEYDHWIMSMSSRIYNQVRIRIWLPCSSSESGIGSSPFGYQVAYRSDKSRGVILAKWIFPSLYPSKSKHVVRCTLHLSNTYTIKLSLMLLARGDMKGHIKSHTIVNAF